MNMLCSNKTGKRTQSIMTIESRLPRCETLKQGLCSCCLHCWQRSSAVHDRLYWSCVRSHTASVTVQFCCSLIHVFVILDCNSLHICRIAFGHPCICCMAQAIRFFQLSSHGKVSVYRIGHQAAYAQFGVLRNRTSTVTSLLRRAIKIHSTGFTIAQVGMKSGTKSQRLSGSGSKKGEPQRRSGSGKEILLCIFSVKANGTGVI